MNTHAHPVARSFLALLIFSVASPAVALAQTVVGSTAVTSATAATGEKVATSATLESAFPPSLPLLKRGPVAVRPHLLYRVVRANGLLTAQQSEVASSTVQTASAGVLLEIGDRWTLDYTNSRVYYSNRFLRDSVDHDAALTGSYAYREWTFTLSQRYTNNSPTLVETAQQTPQETFETDLRAVRRIGQHTRLSTDAAFLWRYVNETPSDPQWTSSNWKTWRVMEFLDYEFSSQFQSGIGVIVGHDIVQAGPDMSHTEPRARLSWQPTDKLSASVGAGIEYRKFDGGRGGSIRNPLYNAAIRYSLLPTTSLTISGNRSLSASYFANWATRNTGWNVGLDQRLLQRFFLNATYAEQQTVYLATTSFASLNRKDNVRMVTTRLSTPILKRGSISLIYQSGRNSSTIPGFAFGTHQYGAEISYHF